MNEAKIFYKQLAYAVFATLTPHRQPTPQNRLRHFAALPTRHPTIQKTEMTNQKILLTLHPKKKYE
jgi:hypothetical protein